MLTHSARPVGADGSRAKPVILEAGIASDALEPAVEVEELRKEFLRGDGKGRRLRFRRKKRVPALKGVTFTLTRGETVAILGQNGSGKSTLVRLLSTLLLHDGGTARIFGHD